MGAARLAALGGPLALSEYGGAYKPKIVRLSSGPSAGRLVIVYGDTPDPSRTVYELRSDTVRPARDVFESRFGCSYAPGAPLDPLLPAILGLALGWCVSRGPRAMTCRDRA